MGAITVKENPSNSNIGYEICSEGVQRVKLNACLHVYVLWNLLIKTLKRFIHFWMRRTIIRPIIQLPMRAKTPLSILGRLACEPMGKAALL